MTTMYSSSQVAIKMLHGMHTDKAMLARFQKVSVVLGGSETSCLMMRL